MLVVAGLSLKNLEPRVWDPSSPWHLPALCAVMISYADLVRRPSIRTAAMEQGLHESLGIPARIAIYLDNGAFNALRSGQIQPSRGYRRFVEAARPDWYPIPRDYIPTPAMNLVDQERFVRRTLRMNHAYRHDGYVPVIHIGPFLDRYSEAIAANEQLAGKPRIALGGIVPNLLRSPSALSYDVVLDALQHLRAAFPGKELHVFGIGGTATLHLAAVLGIDSVDSAGWRNRAARGIIQLPGSGDRMVAKFGAWRGRSLSPQEEELLANCLCPACRQFGVEGLRAGQLAGFKNRATHNLWVILEETRLIQEHLFTDTYMAWYEDHLDNSIYKPLIARLITGSRA